TSSISGKSCSKVVVGFFVNHLGGNPSAVRPNEDFPSTVTRVRTNRCGTSVMLAMPYRKGKRVRPFTEKNSNGANVNRPDIGASKASEIQIPALNERGNFAVRDGPL